MTCFTGALLSLAPTWGFDVRQTAKRNAAAARRASRPTIREPCCGSLVIVTSFAYFLRAFSKAMGMYFVREGNDMSQGQKG